MRKLCFLVHLLILLACSSSVEKENGDIQVEWRLEKNQIGTNPTHQATFILTNNGRKPMVSGWKLYFNTIFLDVQVELADSQFQIRHLAGDFFVLMGKDGDTPSLKPGQKLEITYSSNTPFLKNSHAPEALVLVKKEGVQTEIHDFKKSKLTLTDLEKAVGDQGITIPTAERIFENNESIFSLDEREVPPFLPIPKSWNYHGSPLLVKNAGLGVLGDKIFEQAAKSVTRQIQVGYQPESDRSVKPIQIRIAKNDTIPAEGYHLEIRDQRVLILASDEPGAFYGVQSFLALMPADFWVKPSNEILLPQLEIDDAPDFAYRGFFLDVARNFIPKESVFKILDLMAFYKLNKFHFNLANDEGWRIEIPGLPELTDYASKRGFSEDESEMLWPFYGAGASEEHNLGSGFYTVEDFKEILQYADDRFIEVIPEIGVPAHSRAAIKAMEKRYEKYSQLGEEEEARKYRLLDPLDKTPYLSAQNYCDNTICVCQESTFAFYEKVVLEIKNMYQEQNLKLKTWHTGGDEVPRDVWTESPLCEKFLAESGGLTTSDLNSYFRSRIGDLLKDEGIQLAGWEEIGLKESNGRTVPFEEFSNRDWLLYAWNSVPGWGDEDRAYQLANAGYPVIISSSANFYFDLAYDWDPREPGHIWSGVSDTYQAWKTVPGQLYLSHDQTVDGKPWSWEEQKDRFTNLTEEGKGNIVGVQGQLWTETVRSVDMMEYYLFPKILGLVERAWNGDPTWTEMADSSSQLRKRAEEWNEFSNVLAQKEIPRLEVIFGGVNLRIPAPGLKKMGDDIWANVENPGLEIRWTSDGSIPTKESNLYTQKIPFQEGLKFRTFAPKGTASKVSTLD